MIAWKDRVLAAAALWVAFSAIEALLVGKIDPQETPVGIAIALLAALATVGSLAAGGARYAVPISAIAQLPRIAWSVVRDTAIVTGALLRALGGKPPDDRLQRSVRSRRRRPGVGRGPRAHRGRHVGLAELGRRRRGRRARRPDRPPADAMSVWLLASAALMLGILPCVLLAARGNAIDRLVALELASVFTVLALLAFEQGEQRQSFFDLSLALAVVTFPSSLIFARVLRRWL